MEKASIHQIWRTDGETCFYITGFGFAGDGWRLCYVYTLNKPSVLVSTIDTLNEKSDEKQNVIYRGLGNNWYIKLIGE
jgi:hypothetical protein